MSDNCKNCENPLCEMAGKEREMVGYFCYGYEAKPPMTNADHIRSMTDADLSDFLVRLGGCTDDASCEGCPFENSGAVRWTEKGIEKWLKQPYEGE